MSSIRIALVVGIAACCSSVATAKYPVLSHFTQRNDGPYQPEVRHYVVVDPVAAPAPYGMPESAGHRYNGGYVQHKGPGATAIWNRYDLSPSVYPYGWFGARAANSRSVRGSYYDDYEQSTIFRGR